MIAIKISNKKEFMSKLLASELFDSFLVESISIDTFNSFHIDGRIHKDFYKNNAGYVDDSHIQDNSSWAELRAVCYDLIKGKRTPLAFKMVFFCDDSMKENVIKAADAGIDPAQVTLGLNIKFANGIIMITTGCAYSIFTLDKTIEKAWDSYIPSFLSSLGIESEEYV